MDRATQESGPSLRELLPVLVHIQTHLDGDLSLDRLAALVGLSRFVFHRRFREIIGETPKAYTTRLRLERAAYELRVRDASVMAIALDNGYASHEVFTRAFRRRFGVPPSVWRDRRRRGPAAGSAGEASRGGVTAEGTRAGRRSPDGATMSRNGSASRLDASRWASGFTLSDTRVQAMRGMLLGFIRHDGPYRDVDPASFDRVLGWARRRRAFDGRPILLGIGHDDPTITAADRLRFDACVRIDRRVPVAGDVGIQCLPPGDWAVTTWVGPFGAPLERALADVFGRAMRLRGYELVGLPVVEVYGSTELGDEHALHHTDIMLPLRRRPV